MTRTEQAPINSGYNRHSTATDVLGGMDLTGKTYIVTGGYSGIGLESVRALANAGARVVVPARNRAKAQDALAPLSGQIEIADMDLGDLNSVRKFAGEFAATSSRLDALINNAGIMASPLSRIGNNWESQFATNHIGHFELARGLERNLKNSENARVVALSSTAHIITDVHWDDPHFLSHDYDKWQAYGQSKSANALFALGVDQKWKADGVRAFSAHPGGIMTDLQRHLPNEEMAALGWTDETGKLSERAAKMFKSPEQGGATAVWAATSEQLAGMGGVYCEDCDIAQAATEDSQRWEHAREWIGDAAKADRLWSMTEQMIAEA